MSSEHTPMGIKFWATILILIGGFTSLITVLEVIDSIRFYGVGSIIIEGFISLAGFFVYGLTPLILYSTGMGLFMNRVWAKQSALFIIPFLLLIFFLNQASQVAYRLSRHAESSYQALTIQSDVFIKFFIIYCLFIIPLWLYFTRKEIKLFFLLQTRKSSS